ncbi:MAG TPA: Rid family hydrolase [Gemmatimonadales bacterium]
MIESSRAPEPVGPYPHARRAGPLLFLSGIGPRTRDSREIPGVSLGSEGQVVAYDFERQCRSTLENIKTVLDEAGASLEQVVDVTVFLTNMQDDFATLNRVYGEYFRGTRPARTTVEVTRLPTPIAVEMKLVAWLGET